MAPSHPTMRRRCALIGFCAVFVVGVVTPLQAEEPVPAQERGAALLLPFKKNLMAALTTGMAEGTEAAIEACNAQAPGIAAQQTTEGIRMGRASHRLRNPDNVAPDWVAPVLEAYLAAEGQAAPRVVPIADGRRGYVEPIMLGPLCLECHGTSLSPGVSARIAQLYPEDQATGFALGDLRGVFWVEFP